MPPPVCVLFDLDGTLIDSHNAVFLAYRFALQNEPEALARFASLDAGYVFKVRMLDIMREVAGEQAQRCAESYDSYYRSHARSSVTVYEGVRDMLQRFRADGIALGIVTNKGRQRTGADLDILDVNGRGRDLFDVVVTTEDTEFPKPSPQPILRALERGGWPAAEGIYVGDGPHDAVAALAAGVPFIGALWGYYGTELSNMDAQQCLAASPSELTVLLSPGS